MGLCFSSKTTKANGSNSRRVPPKEEKSPQKQKDKGSNAMVPLGKRTVFGYDTDFDSKYQIGKLLGHGQFGYTHVAIERLSGNKAAVKRIEKKKANWYWPVSSGLFSPAGHWQFNLHFISRLTMYRLLCHWWLRPAAR